MLTVEGKRSRYAGGETESVPRDPHFERAPSLLLLLVLRLGRLTCVWHGNTITESVIHWVQEGCQCKLAHTFCVKFLTQCSIAIHIHVRT